MHVQSVCSGIKMTGEGLQVLGAGVRRQESSRLVLCAISDWWSFIDAVFFLMWSRDRGFGFGSEACIEGLTALNSDC